MIRLDSRTPDASAMPPLGTGVRAGDDASVPAARYRSLLLLGRGGMGSVEAAILDDDAKRGVPRVVALKRILRAEGSDPRRVEMFLREARLTTLLDHPNVVRALSYGECSGELFLAMEYIAGEPLSRLVATMTERYERLPAPMVAYILAEACDGLHAAHELRDADGEPLNVVHRDISPHNVMIGFDGSVKLLDFGVAKIEALESAGRTKTGEVKGKTAYMSPEQAMGETIDRRSDLYSMGAVLFECLTGRRMWGVGTDLEVLRRLALDEPPSLLDAGVAAPAELARLHGRLIERSPSARPATALDVATELRAYIQTSGMKVDRELLVATMSKLFQEERQRREVAIERALSVAPGLREDDPSAAAANESGPVFATDGGVVSQVPTRRGARAVASGAALILMVAFGGVALWIRESGRVSVTPVVTQATPAPTAPPSAKASSPTPSAGPATPPVAPTPPTAATTATSTRAAVSAPPRTAPATSARIPGRVDPKLGSDRPPTKPPEPPDVDPTPF